MNALMTWEVAELVRQKTGIRLGSLIGEARPQSMVLAQDDSRPHLCVLYGPYFDKEAEEPRDARIFVCYRRLEDTVSMQLLVQDADDDVFLNHNAQGAEKFDVGLVHV